MRNSDFKVASLLLAGIILSTVGLFFVYVNFSAQRTSTETTLASIKNFHLNGYPPETLEKSTDNIYRSIVTENITNKQTLRVSWDSDLILGVFIFSKVQFAYFQSILQQMQTTGNTPNALEWANINGVNYEAVGWAREGEIAHTASEPDRHTVVITNAMYGAAYAAIADVNVDLVSYEQTTSFYLFLGVGFIFLGAIAFLAVFRDKNRK